MTITHVGGATLCFQDGYATRAEMVADYVKRLGNIAVITEKKECVEIAYHDGRKVEVTL